MSTLNDVTNTSLPSKASALVISKSSTTSKPTSQPQTTSQTLVVVSCHAAKCTKKKKGKKKKKKGRKNDNNKQTIEPKESSNAATCGVQDVATSPDDANVKAPNTTTPTVDSVAESLGLLPLTEPAPSLDEVDKDTEKVIEEKEEEIAVEETPIFPYPPTPPPGNQQDVGTNLCDEDANDVNNHDDYVLVTSTVPTVWSKYSVKPDGTPKKERMERGNLPGPFTEVITEPGEFEPIANEVLGRDEGRRKKVIASGCLTPEKKDDVTTPSRYRVSPCNGNLKSTGDDDHEGVDFELEKDVGERKERTPMTHIKLGDLTVEEEEEKTELDTPDEKKLVRMLTKKSKTGFSARGGMLDEKYAGWNDYEHVTRMDASVAPSPTKISPHHWVCTTCTLVNTKEHALVCSACGTARKDNSEEEEEAEKFWECKNCTFHNKDLKCKRCEMCSSRRDEDTAFEMEIETPEPLNKDEEEGESSKKAKKGKKKKSGLFSWIFGRRS